DGDARMHNLEAIEALPDFASHPDALTGFDLATLVRVKMQPPEVEAARAIGDCSHQLPTRPQLDLAMKDLALNLDSLPGTHASDFPKARVVFIAYGQMDDEVRRLHQPQSLELALQLAAARRIRARLGGLLPGRNRGGFWHEPG